MIRKLLLLIVLLCVGGMNAQETTLSPYSFYGIGTPKFKGTAENRMMGGLGILADSIHLNLQNPAAFAGLKLTTFTVGGAHHTGTFKDNNASESLGTTTIDYIALGIPAGKLNFGFGLIPYTSVGYEIKKHTDTENSEFEGRGGVNKIFLSAGYQLTKHLSLGVEGGYYFGNIRNNMYLFPSQVEYGTRERNRSDLSGFKFNFGLRYQRQLDDKLQLTTALTYAPETKINSENARVLATVSRNSGREVVFQQMDIDVQDTKLTMPSEMSVGAGIGQARKWFAGFEYKYRGEASFSNRSFEMDNITYTQANKYTLGGYFIPNYKDITSYFNRVVYRAGFRYEENGMRINNQDINEFGMSFGLGLPAGKLFTNVNIGAEYGVRGTTKANLVKENFFSVFISLSLSDKWFQKRKFN
ncbi:hypothetical protein GGR32_001674 [Mesonia hippocampi]|uniref:Outer membrane protein n=1 Tax=Mesonia hippocampi TaxID=1628250 RepID=A0A840EV73_9FLAO|nr:hypothetical protein [Mesonia hippocampi]MBB4119376.1 hypothetical protein [Mesonia hippocampi]